MGWGLVVLRKEGVQVSAGAGETRKEGKFRDEREREAATEKRWRGKFNKTKKRER